MGKLPPYAKGQMRHCYICGADYPERELKKQRGNLVCKYCYDTLTDEQRARMKK
jgi:recombinational DNA repair protein (RecF pathway)